MADVRLQLMQVLVREHQAHAVFPQLAHHVRHHARSEVLELVHVEKEGAPLVSLGAAEGGETNGRGDQTAEDKCAILSKLALRDIHQYQSTLVHDGAEAQLLFGCHEDAIERGIGEKSAELVLDGGYGVRPHSEMIVLKLVQPEA